MNRAVLPALLLLLLLLGAATAATPLPPLRSSDFSHQLGLSVSGRNGVVQLRLPREVYLHARREGLADLRLFDAQGQAVPFALHRPLPQTRASQRERGTRLFPVYRHGGGPAPLELSVRAGRDGALVAVDAIERYPPGPQRLEALVLDLGAAEAGEWLAGIRLLPPAERDSYQALLVVEQSEDLKLWDTLAQSTVDWLHSASADAQLVNDRIDFAGASRSRYLRLRWLQGEVLPFAGVQALWQGHSVEVEALHELAIVAGPGAVAGDWSYAASPAIAATEFGLDLALPNTVLPVAVGRYLPARPGVPAEPRFEPRFEQVFYRLLQDGRERVSSRIAIAATSADPWVVRPQRSGEAAPRLVLRWAPQTLVFTARGSAFTLAFGARTPDPRMVQAKVPLDLVAPGYGSVELARLEHALAGPLQEVPAAPVVPVAAPADPAADSAADVQRRRMLLWGVLLVGVGVLGFMSWRLFQQLGEKPEQ